MINESIKICEMFNKDIKREVKGVVVVDQTDEGRVYTELDEYVITSETGKYFDIFFERFIESIVGPTDKIGVWVSGFFGSGKSHFIKMLSYILENKPINDKTPLEFFKTKIKNPLTISNIEKAVNAGSKDVILFNIDSKAGYGGNNTQVKGKEQIVSIFMKVFNEKRGYFTDVFWIAEMEEDLDDKGLYEKFKEEFKRISGDTWESKRDSYSFEQDSIIDALVNINYMSRDALERLFESDGASYSLSVEKFANKIKKYCEKKGKDHQIIFLVDEVGQYIGDSTDLMLNLQTVVEELGSILKGKAWVIVTSQADIDTITKEQVKGGDFSKIQGRFEKPLNLSSANVDEVIKKRLLEKKPEVSEYLQNYYNEKRTVLKNLILFTKESAEMKNYSSEDNFSESYPFVPYQFNLLQKVLDQIRITGFTGKHLAKGERSMLSAFKEAAENISENELGVLVPFSDFYNSVESFLDPIVKRTIDQAQNNSYLHEEDIKLLKTLFLIKHIKEIKANIENLTALSIENVEQNKLDLRNKITESLMRLQSQTLIHKSEDIYYFLTNEEQEINKEIKNQDVDRHSVRDEIFGIIKNEIIPKKHGIYPFNKTIDDYTETAQKADLNIKFITPQYMDPIYGVQTLHDGSKQCIIDSTDTLLLIFPKNSEFIEQIKDSKKIESYLAHNYSSNQPDVIKRILDEKTEERNKLKFLAKQNIKDRLIDSEVYIDNKKLTIDKTNPTEFIKEGFDILVKDTYKKSSYITQNYESEDEIKRILTNNDMEKWGLGTTTNQDALKDILEYIKLYNIQTGKVLLSDIKSKFTKKPYGWKEMTISGLLAILYKKEEITLKNQQELVGYDPEMVTKYLSKRDYSDKIKVGIREKAGDEILTELKRTLSEVFGDAIVHSLENNESSLFEFTNKKIKELQECCNNHLKMYLNNSYPGKEELEDFNTYLGTYLFKNEPINLFNHILETKDKLKEHIEKTNPINNFLDGPQVKIYNSGKSKLSEFGRNKAYLSELGTRAYLDLKSIYELSEPYSKIKDINILVVEVEKDLEKTANKKRAEIMAQLEDSKNQVSEELDKHETLTDNFKDNILRKFESIESSLQKSKDCSVIISQKMGIDDLRIKLFGEIDNELLKVANIEGKKNIRITKTIKADQFCAYPKALENEEDVEKYLTNLESKLKELIKTQNVRLV